MKLGALNEQALLKKLTGAWETGSDVLTGVGDDCAVLRTPQPDRFLLFKTDAVVEGVHFTRRTPARLIGRKALARALSDIAAMGGKPRFAVVTVGAPRSEEVRRLKEAYRGLEILARRWKTDLVGGETVKARDLFFSVALIGETKGHRPVLRSSARAGDELWVTGTLGATQRRKHLLFEPRLREGEWLARNRLASAMMDVSDGLGADLPRLASASKLAFEVDPERLPGARGTTLRQMLQDGEDYELLIAVPPGKADVLRRRWPFSCKITRIGKLVKQAAQKRDHALWRGYDHFSQR
jgi:thiamine-monophosphate kinase